MKIKMLSDYKSGGQSFYTDEIRVVPDHFGTRLVKNGFAEDVDGNVPTGTKPTGPVRLKPDDIFSAQEG